MPNVFETWLAEYRWTDAQRAELSPFEAPPLRDDPLRGKNPAQTATWALQGFDVQAIVRANVGTGDDAWGAHWRQGFARQMAHQACTLLKTVGNETDLRNVALRWQHALDVDDSSMIAFALSDTQYLFEDHDRRELDRRCLRASLNEVPLQSEAPVRKVRL